MIDDGQFQHGFDVGYARGFRMGMRIQRAMFWISVAQVACCAAIFIWAKFFAK